jgi:hypothetical protein
MYRRRGRTVGTVIIGAIMIAMLIYAVFGRYFSTTMSTPYLISGGPTTTEDTRPTPCTNPS